MGATTETIQGKERDMIDTQVQNRLTFESVQGTFADQTKGLKEHAVWNKAIRILEEYIV